MAKPSERAVRFPVAGLSQSEHFGQWFAGCAPDGTPCAAREVAATLLQPLGRACAGRQRPGVGQRLCRVADRDRHPEAHPAGGPAAPLGPGLRLPRLPLRRPVAAPFARQVFKRSAGPHDAVLPDALTRMEARFLAEQGICRIELPLAEAALGLCGAGALARAAPRKRAPSRPRPALGHHSRCKDYLLSSRKPLHCAQHANASAPIANCPGCTVSPVRRPRMERGGRRFESCHPDHTPDSSPQELTQARGDRSSMDGAPGFCLGCCGFRPTGRTIRQISSAGRAPQL